MGTGVLGGMWKPRAAASWILLVGLGSGKAGASTARASAGAPLCEDLSGLVLLGIRKTQPLDPQEQMVALQSHGVTNPRLQLRKS